MLSYKWHRFLRAVTLTDKCDRYIDMTNSHVWSLVTACTVSPKRMSHIIWVIPFTNYKSACVYQKVIWRIISIWLILHLVRTSDCLNLIYLGSKSLLVLLFWIISSQHFVVNLFSAAYSESEYIIHSRWTFLNFFCFKVSLIHIMHACILFHIKYLYH